LSLLQALVLGLVQGLTEFVPVSSSGHLVLVPAVLGWAQPPLVFVVLLHLGTLVSLLVYFRAELLPMVGIGGVPGPERASPRTLLWMVVATGVTGVLAFPAKDRVELMFESPSIVAGMLVVTAAVLLAAERLGRGERPLGKVGAKDAVIVGAAQALAVMPGLSRSGMTIASGLLAGLSRQAAARFAFLISMPAIAGAAALSLPHLPDGGWTISLAPCIVGFISAAVSGYVAVGLVMGFVQQRRLKWFAGYCLLVGVMALWLLR